MSRDPTSLTDVTHRILRSFLIRRNTKRSLPVKKKRRRRRNETMGKTKNRQRILKRCPGKPSHLKKQRFTPNLQARLLASYPTSLSSLQRLPLQTNRRHRQMSTLTQMVPCSLEAEKARLTGNRPRQTRNPRSCMKISKGWFGPHP